MTDRMTVGVEGYCPMGCGHTLMVVAGEGRITCLDPNCPRPTAVHEILVQETEHVVNFGENSYNLLHPLRERVDGQLLECKVGDFLAELDGPLFPPGRYKLRLLDGGDPEWSKFVEVHRRDAGSQLWPPR